MKRPRALLLTHGEHSRSAISGCDLLCDLLTHEAGLDVNSSADYSELTPERLSTYELIVNYSGYRADVEPSEFQLRDLIEAVKAGTPYVALHCAALMFTNQLYYRRALGRSDPEASAEDFLDRLRLSELDGTSLIATDPIARHRIRIVDRDHPITRDVPDFDITDQLYELRGDLSRMNILAESAGHAVLHTNTWQRGKVHYNGLGHDKQAIGDANFQRLVVQAVHWALAPDQS